MPRSDALHRALRTFADAVARKSGAPFDAGAEEQLRGPFEGLLAEAAAAFGMDVVCTGEAALPNRLGRPDFAVSRRGALVGYVELKAPGVGADSRRFRGRNRQQFKRFSAIPNILYGDGNEWALYRGGERAGRLLTLAADIVEEGAGAVAAPDAAGLAALLRDFLDWEPMLPRDMRGRIDLKGFAALLAPICRLLRDDVAEALGGDPSALATLARDWRQMLFPEATDAQFADAYAQTVAFALLLGRAEGADPLTLESAQEALAARHNLLSRALQVLTDPNARSAMSASLGLLQRVLAVVPPAVFAQSPAGAAEGTGRQRDPWLYFYEDFLAAYDPALRKDAGVYYTPAEVVGAQVRLVDDLLTHRLGRPLGFADREVTTLDPAAGTGTYLLGIVEHALARVAARYGAGAVAGYANELAANLHGFERLVGAYAVSELRVSQALRRHGAASQRPRIFLTDTLESPHEEPRQLPLFLEPISEQHRLALEVKRRTPMIVCIGNPPYDRHEAARRDNGHRTGSWVRWGEDGTGADAIFRDFAAPVAAAGRGGQLKNLYNLYVYFWRWALWKVFEQDPERGGVVSFITASSYLSGDAFLGMREHLRRLCDEIWILDLGGEGRGGRQSDNVFAIQTPVAIAVAMRRGAASAETPAQVRYARIDGKRAEKLERLDAIGGLEDVRWQDCPDGWQTPFLPTRTGGYFRLPLLTDLMPWQHSGVQLKRTWPIAPDAETLTRRWRELMRADNRAALFRETRDRTVVGRYRAALPGIGEHDDTPLAELPADAKAPPVRRYAHRSFDRQHVLADGRLMDFRRPDLWRLHGDRHVYLTTSFSQPLGRGPALAACADVPDLHHFSGRGAKDVIPLYRAADGEVPNVAPGLLDQLPLADPTVEDFAAYLYGALAQPAFTERFASELGSCELRVPITAESGLFREVCAVGRKLLKLHTCHQRFLDADEPASVPPGIARCTPGRAGGRGRLPRIVLPRRRHADAAGRRRRVRAGRRGRLRVRGVRPQDVAVVAALPHEARRRAAHLAPRRGPAAALAVDVHAGAAGADLGAGRHARSLPRTGPAAGAGVGRPVPASGRPRPAAGRDAPTTGRSRSQGSGTPLLDFSTAPLRANARPCTSTVLSTSASSRSGWPSSGTRRRATWPANWTPMRSSSCGCATACTSSAWRRCCASPCPTAP